MQMESLGGLERGCIRYSSQETGGIHVQMKSNLIVRTQRSSRRLEESSKCLRRDHGTESHRLAPSLRTVSRQNQPPLSFGGRAGAILRRASHAIL